MGILGEFVRTLDVTTGKAISRGVSRLNKSLQIGSAPSRSQKAPRPVGSRLSHSMPSYVLLEENQDQPVDNVEIRRFYNIHKGERCFIVGNGPSINQTDLGLLKDEYTFGVNGIFYKTDEVGFRPTYYIVEDSFVLKDNLERIKEYEAKHRFFPSVYRKLLSKDESTSFFQMNRGFYEKSSPNYGLPRFSADCSERIYCGQSVTYINLQLAYYMGFSSVYLIGVDFSYVIPESAKVSGLNIESTEDDPNHFHPDYFGKGKKWHDPQLERVLRNYEYANLVYRWDGRKVLNATKGGMLKAFERADYDSLFN
jgi:hypothetical protein